MNSNFAAASFDRFRKNASFAAIACGVLFASTGCGIPCLRRAQPGRAMPQAYHWNNGLPFRNPSAAPDPDESGPDESGPDESGPDESTPGDSVPSEMVPSDTANATKQFAEPIEIDRESDVDANDRPANPSPNEGVLEFNHPEDQEHFTSLVKPASSLQLNDLLTSENAAETLDGGLVIASDEPNTANQDTNGAIADANDLVASLGLDPNEMDFGITPWENSAQLPAMAFFSDPYLIDLIAQALMGNQEL
jgi:hypothetical protein